MLNKSKIMLLSLIDTLTQAVGYLKENPLPVLIEDCFTCIDSIEASLSEEEGLDHQDYSKVCRASIEIANFKSSLKAAADLKKWVKKKVKTQYKITFMPYKAEMWDSLESVWSQAKADPHCIVQTVPIPYQTFSNDENNNRIVVNKYEGDRFPSYVDVIYYNNYDLEAESPDVIFIHNPYDETNFVTRVDSRFYSSNLIKHTDKLVYIPYFVPDILQDQYTLFPGPKNAWKIFVQSEYDRSVYIKNGHNPKKVVALGSPKYDCLKRKMDEGVKVPLQWETALQGRKVFLYNSSLRRIINEKGNLIEEMNYIIDFFKSDQNIALIWRPHPLSIETINSMRPHLLTPYLSLVEKVKEIPNIVYDLSSDMNTAIILSDAYVGDFSSVILPYTLTGKPVLKLIPNINELLDSWNTSRDWLEYIEEVTVPLSVGCAQAADDKIYFSASNRGGIYSLCLATGECALVGQAPSGKHIDAQLFSDAVMYNDNLWFIPYKAPMMLLFNITTGKMKEYNVPSELKSSEHKFTMAVQDSNCAWLLPAAQNIIEKLDMQTGEFKCFPLPAEFCNDESENKCRSAAILNSKIWILSAGARGFACVDTTSGECEYRELPEIIKAPAKIATTDGDNLWILQDFAPFVIKWNPTTGDTHSFDKFPECFVAGKIPFSGAHFDGSNIWLMPQDANSIIKIITETNEMIVVYSGLEKSKWSILNSLYTAADKERNLSLKSNTALFSSTVEHGEWIYFCPISAPEMIGIHKETGEIKKLPVQISRATDVKAAIEDIFPTPPDNGADLRRSYDNRMLPLKSFVEMVFKGDDWSDKRKLEFSKSIENANGTCGKKIWSYISKRLDR